MKRILVVAGLLVAMSGVAQADIADREHSDANTATVLEAISALSEKVEAYEVQQGNGECAPAPTVFRLCRNVRGMERCSRKYLKAIQ